LATVLLTPTLILLTLLRTVTLVLTTVLLTVLSIALPSLSVVPWATVLLGSSGCRMSAGMVTLRVILDAALLRVQIRTLRPPVTVLALSDCVLLAHRHYLLLLASLIRLSTTGRCSTIAGLTLTRLATTG
jgi:hypothetical protein